MFAVRWLKNRGLKEVFIFGKKHSFSSKVDSYPICSQCTLSLPPENIRKPEFLILSGLENGCIGNKQVKVSWIYCLQRSISSNKVHNKKSLRFSDVFREYRNGPFARKGLTHFVLMLPFTSLFCIILQAKHTLNILRCILPDFRGYNTARFVKYVWPVEY